MRFCGGDAMRRTSAPRLQDFGRALPSSPAAIIARRSPSPRSRVHDTLHRRHARTPRTPPPCSSCPKSQRSASRASSTSPASPSTTATSRCCSTSATPRASPSPPSSASSRRLHKPQHRNCQDIAIAIGRCTTVYFTIYFTVQHPYFGASVSGACWLSGNDTLCVIEYCRARSRLSYIEIERTHPWQTLYLPAKLTAVEGVAFSVLQSATDAASPSLLMVPVTIAIEARQRAISPKLSGVIRSSLVVVRPGSATACLEILLSCISRQRSAACPQRTVACSKSAATVLSHMQLF